MTINRLIEILETVKSKIGGDKEITFWLNGIHENFHIVPRYDNAEFKIPDLIADDNSKMEMQISNGRD